MKRFKSRKKINKSIIYIGIFLISCAFSIRYLYKYNLINNNTIIEMLIGDNLSNFKEKSSSPEFLLKYALNLELKKEEIVNKEEDNQNKVEINKEEDNKTNKEELVPIVYIYNTHQEEKYKSTYLEAYNITPTVLMASKMLKEYLEDLGIGVIVEEDNVTDKLHSLNWSYGSSYKVTRMFMENAKKEVPSLTYFIDLHRDSSVYSATTATIDGESYAKVLFVVGLDHANYEPNLKLAENLRDRIKNTREELFRGIMQKSGKGVNGIYNQDFSPKTMLIEVGGQYNNIREVNNTLKFLSEILAQYIKEDQNG